MNPEQAAAKFSEAYPAGDLDALREVLHPDAVIWHNFDGREQSVEENLGILAGIMSAHTLRYDDIRVRVCGDVVIQQHRVFIDEQSLIDEQTAGAVVEACLVLHVSDGRITRLEEYLDPAQLAVLQGAVAPGSTPGDAGDTEANVAAVRSALAGLQAGDVRPFFGLISDDVVWTIIGDTPISGTVHSKAEFAERVGGPLQSRLAGPIAATPRDIIAQGDQVVALWDGSSTLLNGEPYRQSYCWVFRFADGAIVEASTYWDTEMINRVFRQ